MLALWLAVRYDRLEVRCYLVWDIGLTAGMLAAGSMTSTLFWPVLHTPRHSGMPKQAAFTGTG